MAIQPWRIGKVLRIQDETPDTRRFWIEVPELETFDFIPGQFLYADKDGIIVSAGALVL